jgi:plasmid replication initiation protein
MRKINSGFAARNPLNIKNKLKNRDVCGMRRINYGSPSMVTENENTKKNNDQELKKHVSVIHCSNSLSLLQRKISNILLFHAYPVLQKQEEYKISVQELCNYLEYRGRNHDVIKQALKMLVSTVLEWNVIGDNTEEDWTASSILASVNMHRAVCSYSYSPRMKKLLYSPTMYGKINLSIQSSFTSGYGLALYENCVRYRNLRRTKVFSLDTFRKIMGLSDEKYLAFRDLKKRVIGKAVEEVNIFSDLIVEPNIKRVGQKVVSIYFDVSEKSAFLLSSGFEKKLIVDKLTKEDQADSTGDRGSLIKSKMKGIYFLNEKTIGELIKKYGMQKIEEKMQQIEETPSFLCGKILNLTGFLIEALRKDYEPSNSSSVLVEEKRIKKEVEAQEAKQREVDQNRIIKQYEENVDNQLNTFLESFDLKDLNEIKRQFEKYLLRTKNSMVLNGFRKDGFTNKIARIFFRNFLNTLNLENTPRFVTLEQFRDIDKY